MSAVVVTDGYIAAEKAVFGLVADHVGTCNVFTFGIGSSVNRYLVQGLAKAGQGEPFVVTDPQEAAAAAGRFRRYIEAPRPPGSGAATSAWRGRNRCGSPCWCATRSW